MRTLDLTLFALMACTRFDRVDASVEPASDGGPYTDELYAAPKCEPAGPLVFYPPVTFTPPQQADILRAADAWNAHTYWDHRISLSWEGSSRVLIVDTHSGYAGYYDGTARVILIQPWALDRTYAVALHEFGHALGLDHVKQGVMDPIHVTTEFSEEDMTMCHLAGACP